MIAFTIYIIFNASSQYSIFDRIFEANEINDLDYIHNLMKEKLTFTEGMLAIVAALLLSPYWRYSWLSRSN